MRSGAQTLVLLATPLNCALLRALQEAPRRQTELRRAAGSPAPTTLRVQLKRLADGGTLEKRRRNRFPGVLEYELTPAGRGLLIVIDVLERWLARAPGGPLQLGTGGAKAAVKALAEAWSSGVLRALAANPLSLTELDGVIGDLTYPALQRRLGSMRIAGLVETRRIDGRGAPYAVTDWLRQGVAPLAAAARWERRRRPQSMVPLGRLDAEATFLLALPLVSLPGDAAGVCRLAVEIGNGEQRRLAGVAVAVEGGEIASCSTRLEGDSGARVIGTQSAWLDALVDGDAAQLELGGDCGLARAVLDGLHGALVGLASPPAASPTAAP